ncbi:hypothetical protein AB7B79_29150 [Klebsiella pneumoniae]|nr:hypothetical protein [Klebsiella variicola]
MGNKYTVPLNVGAIRESCFRPADKWTPPTGMNSAICWKMCST